MRARLGRMLVAGLVGAALSSPLAAQCVSLGVPSFSGCDPGCLNAPTIGCGGTPYVGNPAFAIWFGFGCVSIPPNYGLGPRLLLIGQCAAPPFVPPPPVIPAFPSMCPPVPGGCFGYIDLNGVYVSVPGTPIPWWSFAIPNSPSLVGAVLCAQWIGLITVYAPVQYTCIGASNGLSITLLP